MRRSAGAVAAVFAAAVAAPSAIAAAPTAGEAGDLDARFSGDGIAAVGFPGYRVSRDEGEKLAVLGAGAAPTLVSTGHKPGGIALAGQHDIVVARLTPRGVRDRRFSRDGRQVIEIPGTDEIARAAAVQPDGKAVVAAHSESNILVMRLTRRGKLDPTFSGDGLVTIDLGAEDNAGGVAVAPDGSVFVAGAATVPHPDGADLDFLAAKLTPGGALDPGFSSDGLATVPIPDGEGVTRSDDVAHGVALTPGGRIVVAGVARRSGEPPTHVGDPLTGGEFFAAARLLASGELDPGFGGGTVTPGFQSYDGAGAVALDGADRVLLAGAASYDHSLRSGTTPRACSTPPSGRAVASSRTSGTATSPMR